MKSRKKQKFLQIFSDGSLNFNYKNLILTKQRYYFFYQKDIVNFHVYKKHTNKRGNFNSDTKNLRYREYFLNK